MSLNRLACAAGMLSSLAAPPTQSCVWSHLDHRVSWYAHSRDTPILIELLPHGVAVGMHAQF